MLADQLGHTAGWRLETNLCDSPGIPETCADHLHAHAEHVYGCRRATPVAVAAAAALARLAAALHPSDWTSRRTILGALQQLLLTSTQPTAAEMADEEEEEEGAEAGGTLSSSRVALAAAAVEGLGHLGVGVVAQYVEEGYAGVGAPRVQLAGELLGGGQDGKDNAECGYLNVPCNAHGVFCASSVGDHVVHQAGLDIVMLVSICTHHILPQCIRTRYPVPCRCGR